MKLVRRAAAAAGGSGASRSANTATVTREWPRGRTAARPTATMGPKSAATTATTQEEVFGSGVRVTTRRVVTTRAAPHAPHTGGHGSPINRALRKRTAGGRQLPALGIGSIFTTNPVFRPGSEKGGAQKKSGAI